MKQMSILIGLFITIAGMTAFAAELNIEKNTSGYVSLEEGQIVKGMFPMDVSIRADHILVQRMYAGFVHHIAFNPLPIKANVGIEMRMSNEYPRKVTVSDFGKTHRLYFYPYLTQADLSYSFGGAEKPYLNITAGYFPIKYNSNARNLGEYLFRSGTYPQYLVTDFDFPATRLLGMRIDGSLLGCLKYDLILNTNIEWQAIGDLNLTGLVSYNLNDIFEIGGGVSFSSLISADPLQTSGNKAKADESTQYRTSSGDTALLTFKGTKLMGMASFDPKKFFANDLFGKEDLKLFAEAAVLGLKNYPTTLDGATNYDTLMQRIPVMLGFNFPAFKLLDILSVQGEWFGSRLPNDMGGVVLYSKPTPFTGDKVGTYLLDSTKQKYKDDDLKWSVYAKRTLAGHFMITAQIACDHLRWFSQDWRDQDWEDALHKTNQFYYMFKLAYVF